MMRLARGANCGGSAVSGFRGSRVKSSLPAASFPPPTAEGVENAGDARVPKNIEPIPPVNERKKCRRV